MKRFLALFMLISGVAWGVPTTLISTPNSFTPNTTIQSSPMNSNFTEVQNQYNLHTHNDITSVGAITSGSWLGSPVATAYGGTGQNFGASAQGSVPVFSGVGTMSALGVGTKGQVLTSGGAGATASWSGGGSSKDGITRGFEASASVGSVDLRVYSGNVFIGDTGFTSATTTVLELATAGYWSSGSVVTYAGGAGWCTIGVSPAENYVKLLGPARANRSDTAGNSSGTNIYYWDNLTNTYWRVIGAFRINTSNQVEESYSQRGNKVLYDIPVSVTAATSVGSWTARSCATSIPPLSTLGIFGLSSTNAASCDSGSWIRATGTTGSTAAQNGVYGNKGGQAGALGVSGEIECLTDASQSIDNYNAVGTTSNAVDCKGYILDIR